MTEEDNIGKSLFHKGDLKVKLGETDPEIVKTRERELRELFVESDKIGSIPPNAFISIGSVRALNSSISRLNTLGNHKVKLHNLFTDRDEILDIVFRWRESLLLARALLAHREIKKIETILEREDLQGRVGKSIEAFEINQEAVFLPSQIGSVSFLDLVNFKERDDPPAPYFHFIVKASETAASSDYTSLINQSNNCLLPQYPVVAEYAARCLINGVYALVEQDLPTYTKGNKAPDKTGQEIISTALLLHQQVEGVRNASRNLLINPQSPYFPELKDYLNEIFDQASESTKFKTLFYLGLETYRKVLQTYHGMASLIHHPEYADFYRVLVADIGKYIEETKFIYRILTLDEIEELLEEPRLPDNRTGHSIKDLGNIANQISQKSSLKQFEIPVDQVSWGDLKPPTTAALVFDQKHPGKFHLYLRYTEEDGDQLEVFSQFDTSNNIVELNLMEDPTSPNFDLAQEFKNQLTVTALAVLRNILAEVNLAFEARKAQHNTKISSKQEPVKRERFTDPIYALRKEVRQQQIESTASQKEIPISVDEALEVQRVKKVVLLPDEKELSALLAPLSEVDQKIVLEKIQEFNERGTGAKFEPKRLRWRDGALKCALKIGTTTPKGVRVLLHQRPSEKSEWAFDIVSIRYRKDAWRKKNRST